MRAAGECVQERKGVGDREHTVRRHVQSPCFPVYPLVVGDEVVNRIRDESSEEEVVGLVVALRVHGAKNAFHSFDSRWIGQFLVFLK